MEAGNSFNSPNGDRIVAVKGRIYGDKRQRKRRKYEPRENNDDLFNGG